MSYIREVAAAAKSLFGIVLRPGAPGLDQSAGAQNWLRGIEAMLGSTSLTKPYSEHPVIHQAIEAIAEDLASIEWEAFPKGAEREDKLDFHPALDILQRPADGFTRRELFLASTVYYLVDGEAIWYYPDVTLVETDTPPEAVPQRGELALLRPKDVEWRKVDGRVTARLRGTDKNLDLDRMTVFRAFNPDNPGSGLSKTSVIYREARADLGAAAWNEWVLADRNGIPHIILKPPKDTAGLTPKQKEDLKEKWAIEHPMGRRGIGITPPGWDWGEPGGSRKDMEFDKLRDRGREVMLAQYGYPPFLAGVLDKANYANAREQKGVYWRGTIARMLSMFQDKINNDFLPNLGVMDVELFPRWEVVRAMADDLNQKTDIAVKWFGMGLSKRVINSSLEMGWNPDDIPDYDVQYLPMGSLPFGEEPEAPPEDEDEESRTARLASRRDALWRLAELRIRALGKPFESIVRSTMHSIEQVVLSRVRALGSLSRAAESDVFRLLFDKEKVASELVKKSIPKLRLAIVTGGNSAFVDAGIKGKFNPADIRLQAKITAQSLKIRGTVDTVRAQLAKTLNEGIESGETVKQLSLRVQEVMGAAKTRSHLIAQQEMGDAYSVGREVGMKQAGIREHEWVSAKDDKVRATHAKEDGNRAEIGKPFPVTHLVRPLDNNGEPEETIGCRCATIPVVE